MPAENVLELKNIQTHLMFTLVFENGNEEVSLEVGCAEDIELQMKLYINEQWKDLFFDLYDPSDFHYAHFNGISFVSNDNNQIGMQIYGNYKRGSCSLDIDTLADKNAEKLKRIKEIANE